MSNTHWHKATAYEKELAVSLTGGPNTHKRGPKSVNQDATLAPAPLVTERTLRRWRSEKRQLGKLHDPLPAGHPHPLLTDGEKRVIGGKVLDDFEHHQVVSVESLRSSVQGFWDINSSHGYIVKLMSELNLPSKAVHERELKYFNPNLIPEAHHFLTEIDTLLIDDISPNQLVAVDVCYWTNSRHILRSYGPGGRYFLTRSLVSPVDVSLFS